MTFATRAGLQLGAVTVFLLAGTATSQGPGAAQQLAPRVRAAHALNRLTFGPRPGDIDRVMQMGVDKWIEQQLSPAAALDTAAVAALDGCPQWTDSIPSAVASMGNEIVVNRAASPASGVGVMTTRILLVMGSMRVVTSDSIQRAGTFGEIYRQNAQLLACRLARVEATEQQLLEVMTDFWENHFSVSGDKVPTRGSVVEWDRAVIRPHALGTFRDLLGAVAHSPTMLRYLDNDMSSADTSHRTLAEYVSAKATNASTRGSRPGLNENYGRELLELHTLGVDGGYTQADVIGVARAFTGWTHSAAPRVGTGFTIPRSPAAFRFDSTMHDADAKTVLGVTLAAGRGMQDANDVLDVLARHPSTARFIARKLAVRFVSDSPPAALVDRAAATYLRTNGDIREVLRTIFTSPEFWSADAFRAKIKSPAELVLSLRRVMGAPIDTEAQSIDFLILLNQSPLGKVSPEGWPEVGSAWMNAGAMQMRVSIATRIAAGNIASIPVERWPPWKQLENASFDQQVDGVIEGLLSGQVSAQTRTALLSARPSTDSGEIPQSRRAALRDLIGLALSSPEFQRR